MTTIKLLSSTELIKETVYCVWQRSRDPEFDMSPDELHGELCAEEMYDDVTPWNNKVNELFDTLIQDHLPIAEMIDFVFWLDDVPISLREQIVRHRIGTKIDGVPEVDVIPNQAESTWWAQGMRVLDMSNFADNRNYYVPESVFHAHKEYAFEDAMDDAQNAYKHLIASGVPREDARQVIPLGATHGMAWKLNLQTIKHVIGHRACWILQLGMWEPVITGMIEELCKVDEGFRGLATPPCIKKDKYHQCVFQVDNQRRIDGEDQPPPCALYLSQERPAEADKIFVELNDVRTNMYLEQEKKYGQLWNRNPRSGDKLS